VASGSFKHENEYKFLHGYDVMNIMICICCSKQKCDVNRNVEMIFISPFKERVALANNPWGNPTIN
jgi:hypothetical protein